LSVLIEMKSLTTKQIVAAKKVLDAAHVPLGTKDEPRYVLSADGELFLEYEENGKLIVINTETDEAARSLAEVVDKEILRKLSE